MLLLHLAAFNVNTLDDALVTAGVKDLLAALLAILGLHRGLNLTAFFGQWHISGILRFS